MPISQFNQRREKKNISTTCFTQIEISHQFHCYRVTTRKRKQSIASAHQPKINHLHVYFDISPIPHSLFDSNRQSGSNYETSNHFNVALQ